MRAAISKIASKTALAVATGLLVFAPHDAHAQATLGVDQRWYPWLGCWAADSAGSMATSATRDTTCFVPVTGARDIDMLAIGQGQIMTRNRIESAGGGPRTVDSQGCAGTETITWSETGRRAFFQAQYTCAGNMQGTSTTVYAFLPGGKALRVEQVRSGNGSVDIVVRWRPARIPSAVPAAAARAIEGQQRAITTARAGAAMPITIDEVIDAVQKLDADAVRSWVLASDQQFSLNGEQLTALMKSGVPAPVLRAVMGADAPARGATVFAEPVFSGPVYTTPVYAAPGTGTYPAQVYQQPMQTMNVCPPEGCYAPQYPSYSPYSPYSPYYNGFGLGFASPFFGFPTVVVKTERPAPIFARRGPTPVAVQRPVPPRERPPGGRRP